MIRLSSRDAWLLMDVLEQEELPTEERRLLLGDADVKVQEIGRALIENASTQTIEDADVREAVESIRRWADETKGAEGQRSFT